MNVEDIKKDFPVLAGAEQIFDAKLELVWPKVVTAGWSSLGAFLIDCVKNNKEIPEAYREGGCLRTVAVKAYKEEVRRLNLKK